MGSELVTAPSLTKTYTEVFEEACPSYMAMGMSVQEYWDGDCTLARYYREAFDIRQTQKNRELWLQGLYVFEAMSVTLGNAFRKKGAKPRKYTEKPYPVTRIEQKALKKEEEEQAKYNKMQTRMEMLMAGINKKMSERRKQNADN